MPTIVDNIEVRLLDQLQQLVGNAVRVKACIGFLNLKGWNMLGDLVASLLPNRKDPPCRLLVGMAQQEVGIDPSLYTAPVADGTYSRFQRRQALENFRQQLTRGIPTTAAAMALRQLAQQLRDGLVSIRLYLRQPLHAKLYLIERHDPVTPLIGYVGSSNLTFAGLYNQGELNVDVVEQDAAHKLDRWFEERWEHAIDISEELAEMIDHSWAGQATQSIEKLPYLIYLKVAYHLSENARLGATEFSIPSDLSATLLDFQIAAVQLAAKLVQRYGGVLLGDVVGLGKTLMATALARILFEADRSSTLVICPPKLADMWEYHLQRYLREPAGANARVVSLGEVHNTLRTLPRFPTLILDESHNLTNRESKRYRAIAEYIEQNDPRVVLLSATPFNKHYTDLANQLRLFLDEKQPLPAIPERWFSHQKQSGQSEHEILAALQAPLNSLAAFEQSEFPEDWRNLMRHFMVRRTRGFIIRNYATYDATNGQYYVHMNGKPHYFPKRIARTIKISARGTWYERLYSSDVVEKIGALQLARYGLAQYLDGQRLEYASAEHRQTARNLARAGKRLIGFARTNLFKRLESSGYAFIESVKRQILRNRVLLYALQTNSDVPIGEQDIATISIDPDELDAIATDDATYFMEDSPKRIYQALANDKGKYSWLPAQYFTPHLAEALERDAALLTEILTLAKGWAPEDDPKLKQLLVLVKRQHPRDKLLIFTQFADTARYVAKYLRDHGVLDCELVTADSNTIADTVRRFAPNANGGLPEGQRELRVLITTDTLSEGQNLQDCHIVVNFDLPWAIVRLIQRAGRVDRIGQSHSTITVYSFLPAEGIDNIINLRRRLRERLEANHEIIGTDEKFFDERSYKALEDLYTEKSHVLDADDDDDEVDLTSQALHVWQRASEKDRQRALALPPQVFASRRNDTAGPDGAIIYARVHHGTDVSDRLIRLDSNGNRVEQSLALIFEELRCNPDTPAIYSPSVLKLVRTAAQIIEKESSSLEGMLGPVRSLRHRLYNKLVSISKSIALPPPTRQLAETYADLLFRYPIVPESQRQLRDAINVLDPEDLLTVIEKLHSDDKFVTQRSDTEPHIEILTTMGLV